MGTKRRSLRSSAAQSVQNAEEERRRSGGKKKRNRYRGPGDGPARPHRHWKPWEDNILIELISKGKESYLQSGYTKLKSRFFNHTKLPQL